MAVSSWRVLGAEDPEFAAADTPGQSGLVSQLRPLIAEFTEPGDLVFDPFAGWGTTLLACAAEGRRGVGVEIDPERAEQARRRVADRPGQRMLCGDARTPPLGPDTVDLVLCDLPYFGTDLNQEAAGSGQLYALRDYDAYLAALDAILAAVVRVMRPGAYAVVAAQNRRIGDRFVPLAWDVARLLGGRLTLGDERVHLYDWPVKDDGDPMRTNRSHEYLLTARKEG